MRERYRAISNPLSLYSVPYIFSKELRIYPNWKGHVAIYISSRLFGTPSAAFPSSGGLNEKGKRQVTVAQRYRVVTQTKRAPFSR